MAPVRVLRAVSVALALLVSPLLVVGCGGLHAYRPEPEVIRSRYTTIVNYSTVPVDPDQVDAVLVEVAEVLAVQLDLAVPPPHIVVTTPTRIANLYEPDGGRSAWSPRALALYLPGARVAMIPYFDRSLLGYVLAPYVTEHYLTAPRADWEGIARSVEWKLTFARETNGARATALSNRAPAAPQTSDAALAP
jgi:hypothetical protein